MTHAQSPDYKHKNIPAALLTLKSFCLCRAFFFNFSTWPDFSPVCPRQHSQQVWVTLAFISNTLKVYLCVCVYNYLTKQAAVDVRDPEFPEVGQLADDHVWEFLHEPHLLRALIVPRWENTYDILLQRQQNSAYEMMMADNEISVSK